MSKSVRNLVYTSLFAALIAAGAFIRVPIPVIPFTLQTMFVTMAGMLLGSKLGALSAAAYMVIGLIGVPVFTQGGGLAYVLQPTFGYIIGFVAGAFITGFICEHSRKRTIKTYICATFAGLGVIYFIGCVYLWLIKNLWLGANMSVGDVLFYGFLLTIGGDTVLSISSCFLCKRLEPILYRESTR